MKIFGHLAVFVGTIILAERDWVIAVGVGILVVGALAVIQEYTDSV